MLCKNCQKEIDKKAAVCIHCGCKVKKPVFKKWWFWVIIAIVVIIVASSSGNNEEMTNEGTISNVEVAVSEDAVTTPVQSEEIVYDVVDLQTMFDELDSNALKAKTNYKDKYIEITCRIVNFDSDGKYISVEPVNASEWNFTTANCNIKNDEQRNFLIQKNVGDVISVRAKVKSIGEVLGYTFDIKEVY